MNVKFILAISDETENDTMNCLILNISRIPENCLLKETQHQARPFDM